MEIVEKSDIYDLGIKAIKRFIREYQVDCEFNECSRYFASSKLDDQKINQIFKNILSQLGFEHDIFLDKLKG